MIWFLIQFSLSKLMGTKINENWSFYSHPCENRMGFFIEFELTFQVVYGLGKVVGID
jgi:hypothetical protein